MKLKSCPFCGGEAETRYLYCRPYIICSKCHARIPCYNTYLKAVRAWNRREPIDKIVEQLEEIIFSAECYNDDFDGTQIDNLLCLGDAIEIVKGGA